MTCACCDPAASRAARWKARWSACKPNLVAAQEVALCFIRKWWRPMSLTGVGVGTWVNLVIIPLATMTLPNLLEAAAWISALGGLSWVREWGKSKGNDDA